MSWKVSKILVYDRRSAGGEGRYNWHRSSLRWLNHMKTSARPYKTSTRWRKGNIPKITRAEAKRSSWTPEATCEVPRPRNNQIQQIQVTDSSGLVPSKPGDTCSPYHKPFLTTAGGLPLGISPSHQLQLKTQAFWVPAVAESPSRMALTSLVNRTFSNFQSKHTQDTLMSTWFSIYIIMF